MIIQDGNKGGRRYVAEPGLRGMWSNWSIEYGEACRGLFVLRGKTDTVRCLIGVGMSMGRENWRLGRGLAPYGQFRAWMEGNGGR